MKYISLACGNGASENNKIISDIFYKHFHNEILSQAEDAAVFEGIGKLAFSTDSFTISPLFFQGGDIGKLSICGTCNDLVMMGARPKYLSASFIIEEGFERSKLEEIAISMAKECQKNGAKIITGDTKVVGKGSADGVYINTAGVGEIIYEGLSSKNLKEGDVIIVSNFIGNHGASIFAQREGICLQTALQSDCASLWQVCERLFISEVKIKAMRDATRGGLSATLNEWAISSQVGIFLQEESIPISEEVSGICEFLGLEAYALANEGTFVIAADNSDAHKIVEILHSHPLGKNAKIIGEVKNKYAQKVVLQSSYGTKRFLDMPSGEILPRIC